MENISGFSCYGKFTIQIADSSIIGTFNQYAYPNQGFARRSVTKPFTLLCTCAQVALLR